MHHMQKETRQKHSVSAGFVAGAEGLEPSARGFGVDVEKSLVIMQQQDIHAVGQFRGSKNKAR